MAVAQFNVFNGRLLINLIASKTWSSLTSSKLVLLGKNQRSCLFRRLFVPRSQGE
jgi:hypothetical protein